MPDPTLRCSNRMRSPISVPKLLKTHEQLCIFFGSWDHRNGHPLRVSCPLPPRQRALPWRRASHGELDAFARFRRDIRPVAPPRHRPGWARPAARIVGKIYLLDSPVSGQHGIDGRDLDRLRLLGYRLALDVARILRFARPDGSHCRHAATVTPGTGRRYSRRRGGRAIEAITGFGRGRLIQR